MANLFVCGPSITLYRFCIFMFAFMRFKGQTIYSDRLGLFRGVLTAGEHRTNRDRMARRWHLTKKRTMRFSILVS